MRSGVPTLLAKVAQYKPRVVCFIGKQMGETFCKEATRLALSDTGPNSAGQDVVKKQRGVSRSKTEYTCGMQAFKVSHASGSKAASDSAFSLQLQRVLDLMQQLSHCR